MKREKLLNIYIKDYNEKSFIIETNKSLYVLESKSIKKVVDTFFNNQNKIKLRFAGEIVKKIRIDPYNFQLFIELENGACIHYHDGFSDDNAIPFYDLSFIPSYDYKLFTDRSVKFYLSLEELLIE